jgi:hypothetical protein
MLFIQILRILKNVMNSNFNFLYLYLFLLIYNINLDILQNYMKLLLLSEYLTNFNKIL